AARPVRRGVEDTSDCLFQPDCGGAPSGNIHITRRAERPRDWIEYLRGALILRHRASVIQAANASGNEHLPVTQQYCGMPGPVDAHASGRRKRARDWIVQFRGSQVCAAQWIKSRRIIAACHTTRDQHLPTVQGGRGKPCRARRYHFSTRRELPARRIIKLSAVDGGSV